jgi:prolyl 4-hydroxylase
MIWTSKFNIWVSIIRVSVQRKRVQLPRSVEQAFSLVDEGRASEAVKLLNRLAADGDGAACYQLAEWSLAGEIVARDLSLVRELYLRAAKVGLVEAYRRYMALVAVGGGGPRDWPLSLDLLKDLASIDANAAKQHMLIETMQLTAEGDPAIIAAGETVSESPRVLRFRGFFSDLECDYLRDAAELLFEPAETVEEYTGRMFRNPIRTSETAVFPWVGESPAVHALNRRIAAASGTDSTQGEPLQVLRYSPGQEYKPHEDAIPGLTNQRIMTMLVYLNDDFEGGETRFTKIELTIRPRRGDGLLFHNSGADGKPDPMVEHAGLPVQRGVKLLASRWIRQRPVSA